MFSIATSVPLPIAIPISASAKDGLSLTPSPTKATVCPFAGVFNISRFVFRQHMPVRFGEVQFTRNPVHCALVVAGKNHLNLSRLNSSIPASLVSLLDGFGRGFPSESSIPRRAVNTKEFPFSRIV